MLKEIVSEYTDSQGLNWIIVDGSQGEGGGQIFRTSLALAMCLGKAVRIENIRAARPKPGLLRQHLTCLRAAQAISDAQVSGAEIGACSVSFKPQKVQAGNYRFAVGSAGSTSLVLQTVLMPLLLAGSKSELQLEGGTHNGKAPSFDFIDQCFLPLLSSIGCEVDTELTSYGFYPAGGGAWQVTIHPLQRLDALKLCQRGEIKTTRAVALRALIPAHVTARELKQVKAQCDWPDSALEQRAVESKGAGNILSLRLSSDQLTEVFEAVGERGVKAEDVANQAIFEMKRYVKACVPVAEHLADQLILPMALGSGGSFRTLAPSQHLLTNIALVRAITGVNITQKKNAEDDYTITVASGLKLSSSDE